MRGESCIVMSGPACTPAKRALDALGSVPDSALAKRACTTESAAASASFFDDDGDDDDDDGAMCAATDRAQCEHAEREAHQEQLRALRAANASALGGIANKTLASLSDEQMAAVLAIKAGHSVFVSGSAGTGKSHLLKLLIATLPRSTTYVTASTGIAATALGGTTLHNFGGVGLGEDAPEKLVGNVRRQANAVKRWQAVRVLIIDEVSMILPDFFDKLDFVARKLRPSAADQPFGGIQLVVTGDFLQLPPVGRDVQCAYTARAWSACVPLCIVLTRVFRQRDDPAFLGLLANLRVGSLTDADRAMLMQAGQNELPPIHGITPTKLHAMRFDTAKQNDEFLDALGGDAVVTVAVDAGDAVQVANLVKTCQAPTNLRLKVGAQVMLLKNRPAEDLCNGSRGRVVRFVMRPMQSAAAHSLLARARASATETLPIEPLPIVLFENGVELLIDRVDWEIKVGGVVMAARSQVPLTLAWALTIHKSQGMTLDRAEINAHGIFEKGQLYVAVSRMRSMAGVRLNNFTTNAVRADARVVEWYRGIEPAALASTRTLLATRADQFPTLAAFEATAAAAAAATAAAAAAAAAVVAAAMVAASAATAVHVAEEASYGPVRSRYFI